ncbi:hypothetical protein RND81_09G136800 [Saponaria officinalis]|uniref:Alpha 1,4-glycosyltransferase domain-containing protein n=1 Tax=Saponaria officinalis TaxID=3572 RepID=A0AAW1ILD1_SAPOF
MLKRKFFIPSTFTSICCFCSLLFATLFFSFVYLHPRVTNNNYITTLNINTLKTRVISSSSKGVASDTVIDDFSKKADVNLTAPANNNDDVLRVQVLDSAVIELGLNSSSNDKVILNEKISNVTTTTNEEDVDEDEDYDLIPSLDVLSNPPWNCTREERIIWLKNKLDESKILKSTMKTRNFQKKIHAFLYKQGNITTAPPTTTVTANISDNNVTNCKVRVFLTWISPASLFGKRELLALESILKTHPDGCVMILSRTMDSKPGRSLLQPLIDLGYRILPIAPDFQYLFDKTPAQNWLDRLQAGEVDPGMVPITQNLSNLLRMVLLYKYGGVYLDTDIILLKSVSGLKNSIGIQSTDDKTRIWRTLNNAVLIFDKEHPLVWEFMVEFATTFDGFKWGFNGPYLTTRVVSKFVNNSLFQFNFMSPMAFYPIDWIRIPRLFEKPYKNGTTWAKVKFDEIDGQSYGIHLWNKQTRSLKIEKLSAMGRLISEHCIICQDVYDS